MSSMAHTALSEMYVSCNGAPWDYPKWQEVTGIRNGLFPVEDEMLPLDWTREVADEVCSYFHSYALRPTPEARITFSTSSDAWQLPGHEHWVEFCYKIWQTCKIHSRITSILHENIHHIASAQRTADWPFSSFFMPQVLGSVGIELFGIEALDDVYRLDLSLGSLLVVFISDTWIDLRTGHKAGMLCVNMWKTAALEALDDIHEGPATKAQVKDALFKVRRWKALSQKLLLTEHDAAIKKFEQELQKQTVQMTQGQVDTHQAKG